MITELLALQQIKGLRWTIQRADYSWQDRVEYSVYFRFDCGGDEISITRVGQDLKKIFEEAHGVFKRRLGGAFSKQELYPTAIEHKADEVG